MDFGIIDAIHIHYSSSATHSLKCRVIEVGHLPGDLDPEIEEAETGEGGGVLHRGKRRQDIVHLIERFKAHMDPLYLELEGFCDVKKNVDWHPLQYLYNI